MPWLGESAALATAICWTGSSLFFALATRRAGGIAVNQFRLWLALPLLSLLHLLLLGTCWPALDALRLLQLAVSGLVGLVLGDIGYFYALGVIGPRIGSVLMATWPAMATALAWAFHGERASALMLLGIATTLAGVVLVLLRQRDGSVWLHGAPRGSVPLAVAGALLGALGQAGGSVLAAVAMAPAPDQPEALPGLSAVLVRMAAASCGIALVTHLLRRPAAFVAVVRDRAALRAALLGTAFGPIAGVWLSMFAFAHASVGVAAELTATTPIFMMPVAKVAYGARVGAFGVLGTLLAVAGVVLLCCSKGAG